MCFRDKLRTFCLLAGMLLGIGALSGEFQVRYGTVVTDSETNMRYFVVDQEQGGNMGDVYQAVELDPNGNPTANRVAIKIEKKNAGEALKESGFDSLDGPTLLEERYRVFPEDPRLKYVARERPTSKLILDKGKPPLKATIAPFLDGLAADRLIPAFRLASIGKTQELHLTPKSRAEAQTVIRSILLLAHDLDQAINFYAGTGLLHNDIKLSNVMIIPGEMPKYVLFDSGLVTTISFMQNCKQCYNWGTSGHIPPEKFIGGPDIGFKSDRYSLAATLWNAFFDDRFNFSLLESEQRKSLLLKLKAELSKRLQIGDVELEMLDTLTDMIVSDSDRLPQNRGQVTLKQLTRRFDIEAIRKQTAESLNEIARKRGYAPLPSTTEQVRRRPLSIRVGGACPTGALNELVKSLK